MGRKKSDYICSRRIYSRSFEQTDEKALSLLLKQTFGIDADITFKNNEEMFHKSSQKFREVEEEDIRRSLEEYTRET